jgi:hypothetical protein
MAFSRKLLGKSFLLFSIGLFIVSLTQKCYCTENSCGDSLAALFSGALGFFLSPAGFSWLANPLIIISWATTNRKIKLSLISSIVAFLMALSFMFFDKIIANEGGSFEKIVSYKLGYWLWLSGIGVMVIRNLIFYRLPAASKKY